MQTENTIIELICAFFIVIVFYDNLQAQNETDIRITEKDSTYANSPVILNQFRAFNYQSINRTFDISTYFGNNAVPNRFVFLSPEKQLNRFDFDQQYFNTEFPGLGSSKWFNNQFIWNAGNHVSIGLETGLAIQNTIFDPFIPNFQYTLGITLEYAFNEKLKAYFFGQYISAPLNKPGDYFDPLLFNNSLFLQSESGFGIQSTIKNTWIDFRISSGYNQQLKSTNNFNSKLNIRF